MAQEINSTDNLYIYNNNRHLKIYAGPGAGKTHLLIENIKHMVQHSVKLKSSFRRILCITYTNIAVEQIRSRLGSFNNNVVVSTIHSFINEYVIKPNQIQLKEIIKKEFGIVIDQNKVISSVQEGFTVLSGHKKEDVYEHLQKKYAGISTELYLALSKSKMAEIQIDIINLNTENIEQNKETNLKFDKKLDLQLAMAIKDYIWSEAGRLSFDEILYFGLKILSEYKLSTHLIRCEFPYILIDEYQDTNPIQNKIVKVISADGCIVTVIGDVAQSIYSFQGATYSEFQNFSLNSNLPIDTYVIKGNRRSTQNIIDFINYLRQEDKELNDQTCELNFDSNLKVTFLLQKDKNNFSRPLHSIIEKDSVILSRKWAEALKYISNLGEEQRKLLNDIINAYTFQFRRNLENEIQAKREAWIESMIAITELEDAYKRKCIPSAFAVLEKYVNVSQLLRNFSEDNNKSLAQVIVYWENINRFISETKLLKDLIFKINGMLQESGLTMKGYFRYPVEGDEDYVEGINKLIDKLDYSTAKKITEEIFSPNSKYMTIHKAKGAEFENVLINIEPAARLDSKECVPLNIICKPVIFNGSNDLTNKSYEEFTRIVYVAASRAKNKLYIHLYGDEKMANVIDNALGDYCEKVGKEKFFDFEYC